MPQEFNCPVVHPNRVRPILLTEKEVSQSWLKLFSGAQVTDEKVNRAEALIDELRPESPLRHRLDTELEELRTHSVG